MRSDEERAKVVFDRHQEAALAAGRTTRIWVELTDAEKAHWVDMFLQTEKRHGGMGDENDWGMG